MAEGWSETAGEAEKASMTLDQVEAAIRHCEEVLASEPPWAQSSTHAVTAPEDVRPSVQEAKQSPSLSRSPAGAANLPSSSTAPGSIAPSTQHRNRNAAAASSSAASRRPASAPRERTASPNAQRSESVGTSAPRTQQRTRRSRPQSAPRTADSRRESAVATSRVSDARVSPRIESLAQPKRRSTQQQQGIPRRSSTGSLDAAAAASDSDADDEQNECTFKPRISASAARLTGYRRRLQSRVEDRLHKAHEEWQEAREDAKRQLEEDQLQACTFKPQLDMQSRKLAEATPAAHRPLHERVGDVLKRKQEAAAEAASERHEEYTFRPQLGDTSVRLAQAARVANTEPESFVDRLSDPNRHMRERKSAGVEAEEREQRFQPKVCSTSERIVGSLSEMGAFSNDFLERQQDWIEKVECTRRAQSMANDDSCTFKPDTGNADAVLARSRHVGRLGESEEERWQRLSTQEAEQKEVLIASLAEEQYGKFPFKPQLCETSEEIGHTRDIDELASNESKLRAREEVARQLESSESQECTFRPQIKRVPSPNRVGPPEALIDRITELQRQRDALWQQQRAAAEYEEVSECTFAPETNKKRPRHQGPIVVRGLGRHLELSELRRRKEDERKQKQEEVFHENPQPPKNGRTVTEPFKLRSEHRDGRKGNGAADGRRKQQKASGTEFTFRPETEARRRRNIIASIL